MDEKVKLYQYPAVVLRVVDGDTVKLAIRLRKVPKNWPAADLGFRVNVEAPWLLLKTSVRLVGINSPETTTEAGKAAKAYLNSILKPGDEVMIQSELASHVIDSDKYGDRWLAVIKKPDFGNVNEAMVTGGHAVRWNGQGPKPTAA